MHGVFTEADFAAVFPPGIERHFWHRARNALVLRELRRTVRPGERVLDVGCGPGVFLLHAVTSGRGSGLDIVGVEQGSPPSVLVEAGRVRTGTDVFELPPAEREQVAVLLLLDVLEHIDDRPGFLRALREAFPNCRHLLLTVPARMELWSDYDSHWGHRLRYDRDTLGAELDAGGFAVEHCRYLFPGLYVAARLAALLGLRRRGGDFVAPSGAMAALHGLAALYLGLESRLLPGFLPGSSLLAVARAVCSR